MPTNLINPFRPCEPYEEDLQLALLRNVRDALQEDMGSIDLTALLVPEGQKVSAVVVVRENAILCGASWFDEVMNQVDSAARVDWKYQEGQMMQANTEVCEIHALARSVLTAERSALNFIQLLSAVATATHKYVKSIEGLPNSKAAILDTRKTIPGLRLAEKYAVRVGGGKNQRLALYDGVLIKENHIASAGGVPQVCENAKQLIASYQNERYQPSCQIEVENLEQLQMALNAGMKSILLDNFDTNKMKEAVLINKGRALLEASGGVDMATVSSIAVTGVDRISIGSLTKDIKAVDFSMRVRFLQN